MDFKEVNDEKRKVQITCPPSVNEPVIDCKRFSTWKRLLKVTAYVIRFCHNLCNKTHRDREGDKVAVDPPDAEEVEKAEEFWIKKSQVGLSTTIAKGNFKTLNPFVDDKGITRVGGRVDSALVSYDSKDAALLPYDHWISRLITHDAHRSGHPGIATTTAKTRRKYWIVKENKLSKIIKHQCTFNLQKDGS